MRYLKKMHTESKEDEIKAVVETLEAHEFKPPSPPVPQTPASKKKAAGQSRKKRAKKENHGSHDQPLASFLSIPEKMDWPNSNHFIMSVSVETWEFSCHLR